MPVCFILFCFVFHRAVGIVNWKFIGMHVSVAYDAVSSSIVFSCSWTGERFRLR